MVRWAQTTHLPTKVTYEFDSTKHEWVIETTTNIIHTIHEHRRVDGHLHRSDKTLIGNALPSPKETLSTEMFRGKKTLMVSPIVEYVPYMSVSAPRLTLVHPTRRTTSTLHVSKLEEGSWYSDLLKSRGYDRIKIIDKGSIGSTPLEIGIRDNALRHNLDVMHIEKNMCNNVVFTIFNDSGKSKTTSKLVKTCNAWG
ncbi:hypothetical protein PIB30_073680 [Stylosanthes scabra]|uniref:Uncharacterized protein n=1 Tax=Stylosanthes scabra TaxID=79078 RepID=A0ABU6SPJ5_9FABA|nr:hypothetical protein [Stylosanthes scabra]